MGDIMVNQSKSSLIYKLVFLLQALLLGIIGTLLLIGIVSAAEKDSDSDGVNDSNDNCPYVSNADQLDNVSAFVIGDGDKWTTTFVPIWAPSDKSNTRVYVGGFLKTSGTDYSWSSDGTKLEFTSAPKLGEEVRLVVLEDQDGRGDKCSPDLTVDFDGIPDNGDNCPLVYNPYQENTWGTSQGDACEVGSGPAEIYQVWAKLYEHANFTGIEEVIRVNDVLLSGNAIGDDAVSSIRVGPHTAVYLYTLPNYGGDSEFFGTADSDFMDNQIGHDTASSIRMYSTAPIEVTKISTGIDFWSSVDGHVGHIATNDIESLVSGGSGSSITLEYDYADRVQSITVRYDGEGDYVVSTTKLDGNVGETAHFHYEGVLDTSSTTENDTNDSSESIALAKLTTNKYIVQSGDYLFQIASLYNVSVQSIIDENNIANANIIFVGQELVIP